VPVNGTTCLTACISSRNSSGFSWTRVRPPAPYNTTVEGCKPFDRGRLTGGREISSLTSLPPLSTHPTLANLSPPVIEIEVRFGLPTRVRLKIVQVEYWRSSLNESAATAHNFTSHSAIDAVKQALNCRSTTQALLRSAAYQA
jgi:hypothetical protein